jgi:hypothetical protein
MGQDQDKIEIRVGAGNLTVNRTIPVGPLPVPEGYLRLTPGNGMFIHMLFKTPVVKRYCLRGNRHGGQDD